MPDIAVILLTLNEEANLPDALESISGFASEVWVLDSFSTDRTVDIALAHGASVAQRAFRGFGEQWNFALNNLAVRARWTMKMDPDERMTDELKTTITDAIESDHVDGLRLTWDLCFLGRPLGVRREILRVWRTGTCRFTDVSVNEHPIVDGRIGSVAGSLIHVDSPTLHAWVDKQNRYTTEEAYRGVVRAPLGVRPSLRDGRLSRRMWVKRHYLHLPFRFTLIRLYSLLIEGAWRSGRTGIQWSHLRAEVHRLIWLKEAEMRRSGSPYQVPPRIQGAPDPRARQYD